MRPRRQTRPRLFLMPDAVALARLHSACFTTPRPWSAEEFAGLLRSPLVFAETAPQGVLLGRVIADEAEVLTLAIAPEARRMGLGAQLVAQFLVSAGARGATTAYLEVAADNAPAIALYARAGFFAVAERRAYYRDAQGKAVDAMVLRRAL